MKLIFLFSLPRSGSTLLQRLLATHPRISTTSEPWLLLPLLYTLRHRGIHAEFDYRTCATAIEDLCRQLPRGEEDYLQEIRQFTERVYRKASRDGSLYFVDKTPRYHLIVEEIFRLFPDSKKIFLWRNPLGVVASMISTWGGGRWNLHRYRIDLFRGLERLIRAHQRHGGEAAALSFEDLLTTPEAELERIFSYLGLPFQPQALTALARIQLPGRAGDQSGVQQYGSLSREPLDKWRAALCSPVRKAWCRRYLRWIGPERLGWMGYDLEGLLADLEGASASLEHALSDAWRMLYGLAYTVLEPHLARQKLKQARSWQDLYPHL